MDATQIVTVSAAVVGLTQLLKWMGVDNKMGPIVVMIVSAICTFGFVWSQIPHGLSRQNAFGVFAAWVAIFTSAAGVFGYTRSGADALVSTKSPPEGPMSTPTSKP